MGYLKHKLIEQDIERCGCERGEEPVTEVESETNKPIVFLECQKNLSQDALAALRADLQAMSDDYQFVLLGDGVKLATQQAWKPANLDIECGTISIRNNTGVGKGTVLLIDGVEQKKVRAIDISIRVNEPIAVKVEFLVRESASAASA